MTSFPKMEGIESAVPEVKLTESLRERITQVRDHIDTNKTLKQELEQYSDGKNDTVPFSLVTKIHKSLKAEGDNVYLHTLLQDSDIHLPTVKFPPRSPELEARIKKLEAEQANREYKDMTRNVDRKQQDPDTFNVGQEVKALNRQMIAVGNFLVTVGGAFAFGYKATEYAVGPDYLPMQMMSGLIFGTIVFFADLYFLVRYTPE